MTSYKMPLSIASQHPGTDLFPLPTAKFEFLQADGHGGWPTLTGPLHLRCSPNGAAFVRRRRLPASWSRLLPPVRLTTGDRSGQCHFETPAGWRKPLCTDMGCLRAEHRGAVAAAHYKWSCSSPARGPDQASGTHDCKKLGGNAGPSTRHGRSPPSSQPCRRGDASSPLAPLPEHSKPRMFYSSIPLLQALGGKSRAGAGCCERGRGGYRKSALPTAQCSSLGQGVGADAASRPVCQVYE